MTPPRPDLQKLPPIARAQAMHRPYRPGRSPMVYGLLITVAINLGWGAWALFGSSGRVLPDWARPQDILIPATLLPAPTTPPPPRVGAAPEATTASQSPAVEPQMQSAENKDEPVEAEERPEVIDGAEPESPAVPATLTENRP